MWKYTYENELAHHGVKGMKWGVRKKSPRASGKRKREDDYHEDYKKVHDKKSVKYMSDQELRTRNNRLNAEKQYESMTKKASKGKSLINAYIAGGTTLAALATATAAYRKHGSKIVDNIVSKFGDKIVKDIVIDKVTG